MKCGEEGAWRGDGIIIWTVKSSEDESLCSGGEQDRVPSSISTGRVDSAAFQQIAKRPFRRHEAETYYSMATAFRFKPFNCCNTADLTNSSPLAHPVFPKKKCVYTTCYYSRNNFERFLIQHHSGDGRLVDFTCALVVNTDTTGKKTSLVCSGSSQRASEAK
jgi:hypothetical protein